MSELSIRPQNNALTPGRGTLVAKLTGGHSEGSPEGSRSPPRRNTLAGWLHDVRATRRLKDYIRGNPYLPDIDRSVEHATYLFTLAFADGETPLQVSSQIVKNNGAVKILDAGCGTGNTVSTWADSLRTQYPNAEIHATGLNDVDFSHKSANSKTREMIEKGEIDYVVAKMEHTGLRSGEFDVVSALESMIYSLRPEQQLREFLRITAPGGHIFFNLGAPTHPKNLQSQRRPFQSLLGRLEKEGYIINHETISVENSSGIFSPRDFYHIVKPTVDFG